MTGSFESRTKQNVGCVWDGLDPDYVKPFNVIANRSQFLSDIVFGNPMQTHCRLIVQVVKSSYLSYRNIKPVLRFVKQSLNILSRSLRFVNHSDGFEKCCKLFRSQMQNFLNQLQRLLQKLSANCRKPILKYTHGL